MDLFTVKKSLNNNVIIAEDHDHKEVVLIGKGIGFNRKKGEQLDERFVEKIFILKDKDKQEQYKSLLLQMDNEIFDAIIDAMEYIKKHTTARLNEHIHVALTDHLMFSIYRTMKGVSIHNPFLVETKNLYPQEFNIASKVVKIVNEAVNIHLPEDEIGFIALHIHSAIKNKKIGEVNKHSNLIKQLVDVIEDAFNAKIDKKSIDYIRLIRHLRFAIERTHEGDELGESTNINLTLQNEYPFCYNLSWKLIKIMQNTLKKPVGNAEAVYLTMHLQRIYSKLGSQN
ncbi:transcription antiterminator [Caldibacillus thermolactis]|jgi:transcriptional antiterminator|uniref:Transcription antiterminator n=1 Tax=Pallidibacillus thermolactis TaxID=251051 RepID=A0ABT2WD35_9BACI|nr:transcription antiterminator [Pallidibacillus thermolactis]MCU9593580.1 transcription antiterminator [Pallidibacillus thermolactis]